SLAIGSFSRRDDRRGHHYYRRVSRRLVVIAYSTAALALAAQWTAAKLALAAIPPFALSTLRFAIASVLLVVVAVVTRTRLPIRRWRPVMAAAVFGFVGFNALAFLGLRLTPASDSALIVPTTIPVATALLATLIHERLTSRRTLGLCVASVGAAIVIVGGQPLGGDISTARLLGDLLEIGSAFAWAACLTISTLVVRTESVLGFVTMSSLVGTALLFPLGFLENGYADIATMGDRSWSEFRARDFRRKGGNARGDYGDWASGLDTDRHSRSRATRRVLDCGSWRRSRGPAGQSAAVRESSQAVPRRTLCLLPARTR